MPKNSNTDPKPQCVQTDVSSSFFIGDYKIDRIDIDNFKITKKYNDEFFNEAVICGGDFETLLSCLFIRQEIKYTCYDRIMKTDIIQVIEDTHCTVCGNSYKNPNNDSDTCYDCREPHAK